MRDITYYYCSACDLLQNFYLEELATATAQQTTVNQEMRMTHWPAGEKEEMYRKGWAMLELMGWPVAWQARRLNESLKLLPAYASFVKRFLKKKLPRLLDFGCGHGVTVLQLRQRDNFDIIGLDPFSPTPSPFILRQSLFASHLPGQEFDGIFSIETLEHIPNFLDIFTEFHRLLKPGGVLLVQTRRLEDPDYHKEGKEWFYLEDPRTHVTIYSQTAMRTIARRTGWRGVSFKGVKFARFVK